MSESRTHTVEESFNGMVGFVRFMLDEHYPAHIFTGISNEPGPVLVAAFRRALNNFDDSQSTTKGGP